MSTTTPDFRAPETIHVPHDTQEVKCDGGNPVLGHPAVYYRFENSDRVVCGYCDREFVRKA